MWQPSVCLFSGTLKKFSTQEAFRMNLRYFKCKHLNKIRRKLQPSMRLFTRTLKKKYSVEEALWMNVKRFQIDAFQQIPRIKLATNAWLFIRGVFSASCRLIWRYRKYEMEVELNQCFACEMGFVKCCTLLIKCITLKKERMLDAKHCEGQKTICTEKSVY